MFKKLIQNFLRVSVIFKFNHDSHSFSVAFVAQVANSFYSLACNQFGNFYYKLRLIHLIRNFRDYNIKLPRFSFFYFSFRSASYRAPARRIRLNNRFFVIHNCAGRKIGSLNKLHKFFISAFRVVRQINRSVHYFGKIVRRNICRHSDGDAD